MSEPQNPTSRVLVVTSDVPFVEGGHRVIAGALRHALRAAGHEAEVWTTPQNRFGRQLSAYLATRWTDVEVTGDGAPVDRVISLRFPSYMVRHPRHVVWLNHRMREYYDLWPDFRATLGARGRLVEGARRRLLTAIDTRALHRLPVFAQSQTIADRLRRWGGVEARVLYPPAPPRPYRCDRYDGTVLAVARLTPLKRIDLLIRAAAKLPDLRVRVAGCGPEEHALAKLAGELGIGDRVEFLGRVGEGGLLDELARCSAVYNGARAEDYGLVTLEAFSSSKAVLTCTDSGGPAELVEDGHTGFVVEPNPAALAAALGVLSDTEGATTMGTAAASVAAEHRWPATVRELLSAC